MHQALCVGFATSTPSTGVAKGKGGIELLQYKNNDNEAFFQLKFFLALLHSTVQN